MCPDTSCFVGLAVSRMRSGQLLPWLGLERSCGLTDVTTRRWWEPRTGATCQDLYWTGRCCAVGARLSAINVVLQGDQDLIWDEHHLSEVRWAQLDGKGDLLGGATTNKIVQDVAKSQDNDQARGRTPKDVL